MVNREVLRGLADNPALMAAVRGVIEEQFAMDNLNTNMVNEVIGQVVRANIDGWKKVEAAFKIIEQCKSAPQSTSKSNPAK